MAMYEIYIKFIFPKCMFYNMNFNVISLYNETQILIFKIYEGCSIIFLRMPNRPHRPVPVLYTNVRLAQGQ
jgi:hypothetical protein